MRVLLDRCVTRKLRRLLTEHDVTHASKVSWGELVNGRLIARATEEGYDVLLTVDKSMSYQNSPAPGSLAVLVIFAMDTRTDALAPRVSEILAGIESAPRGEFTILTLNPSEV